MNAQVFRQKRAQELRQLNQLLYSVACCKNPEVLLSPASLVSKARKGGGAWGYSLDGLKFQIDDIPQQTLPKKLKAHLDVIVSLSIEGDCVEEDEHCSIHHLILDVEISSINELGYKCMSAWHFDSHIHNESEHTETHTAEAHPYFHFQHGGHKMETLAEQLGSVLLTSAPRLAFPPMDALLAIDFILSNFCGKDWQILRGDANYKSIVRAAQERLWKPYFKMISNFWEPGAHATQSKTIRFWPHLIS